MKMVRIFKTAQENPIHRQQWSEQAHVSGGLTRQSKGISHPIVGIRVALYPHELMLRAGELTTHAVTTVVDLRDNKFYKPTPCYKRKMDAQFGHFRLRNNRPERQFMRGQTEMGTRRSKAKNNGTESNRIAEERA
jgi:hypothetical protein